MVRYDEVPRNQHNLDVHMTDEYMHWSSPKEEFEKVRELYEKSLEGNSDALYHLIELISENSFDRGFDAGLEEGLE